MSEAGRAEQYIYFATNLDSEVQSPTLCTYLPTAANNGTRWCVNDGKLQVGPWTFHSGSV